MDDVDRGDGGGDEYEKGAGAVEPAGECARIRGVKAGAFEPAGEGSASQRGGRGGPGPGSDL